MHPDATTPSRPHRFVFLFRVIRDFVANQGFLLAGAIAYYTLLSLVPLLVLTVLLLSQFLDQALLIQTLSSALDHLLPARAEKLLGEIQRFLNQRRTVGLILLGTLIFFSAQAFSCVQKAMAVIFAHREVARKRPLVALLIPYLFVLLLVLLLLAATLLGIALRALPDIHLLGWELSLDALTNPALTLLALVMEVLIFTAIYMVLPPGRTAWRHALLGGLAATALWEATRYALTFYFSTIFLKAGVVYGSMTTAVVVLISMEVAAILLLLGAQVVAEQEKSCPARPY